MVATVLLLYAIYNKSDWWLRKQTIAWGNCINHSQEFQKEEVTKWKNKEWLRLSVATIVQGAIVQGNSCPRRQLSKGQLSKDTFVQGDFCSSGQLFRETNVKGDSYIYFYPRKNFALIKKTYWTLAVLWPQQCLTYRPPWVMPSACGNLT